MRIRNFDFQDYLNARFCRVDDEGDEGGGGSGGDAGGAGGEGGLMANAGDGGGDEGGKGGEGGGEGSGDGRFIMDGDSKVEVPEQFWDAEKGEVNQSALLKSQGDNQKALRQTQNELAELKKSGKGDIPENAEDYLSDDVITDGVFAAPDGVERLQGIPVDDPGLVGMAEMAQKHGLTPEQFTGIVTDAMLLADGFMPEPFDEKAELEKLGDKGQALVSGLRTWADGLMTNGHLSEDEHAYLLAFGQTAIGVTTLSKLRADMQGQAIPLGNATAGDGLPSKDQWYANRPDPGADPDGFAKWQKQGEQIFGTDPAGTSQSGLGVPASRGGAQQRS